MQPTNLRHAAILVDSRRQLMLVMSHRYFVEVTQYER